MKRMIGLLMLMGLMVSVGGCGKDGPTRFVEYYENGQVEVEGNRKDGERDGKWVWYDENGKIEAEGSYKDGYKIGKWVYYYEDGQLRSEEYYDDEYIVLRRCESKDSGINLGPIHIHGDDCTGGAEGRWVSVGQIRTDLFPALPVIFRKPDMLGTGIKLVLIQRGKDNGKGPLPPLGKSACRFS